MTTMRSVGAEKRFCGSVHKPESICFILGRGVHKSGYLKLLVSKSLLVAPLSMKSENKINTDERLRRRARSGTRYLQNIDNAVSLVAFVQACQLKPREAVEMVLFQLLRR
jgi:hypothetical protein